MLQIVAFEAFRRGIPPLFRAEVALMLSFKV